MGAASSEGSRADRMAGDTRAGMTLVPLTLTLKLLHTTYSRGNLPPTRHLCHAVTYPYPSCAGLKLDACPAVVLCHGDVGLSTHTEGEWVSGESRTCTGGLAHGVICVSLIG